MRQILTRAAALGAVLLVAVPSAAAAAVDEYAAEASTSAVKLSVFEGAVGDPVLDLIGTDAFGSSDPMASASIDVVEVLGTSIGDVRTADSDGERVRDPEEGDGCTLPVSATGLTLSAICTVATAQAGAAGDTGNQDANATAELLDVGVSGSFLSAVLTEQLGVLLTDLTAEIADGLLTDAINQFIAECNELLANEGSEIVLGTAGDLLAMTPEELDGVKEPVQDAVAEADQDGFCAAVFNLTVEGITAPVVDVGPIAEALDGVTLIELTMDGASSDIAGTDTDMTATAEQVFVTVTGPALDFLDDLLVALIQGVLDGIVAEIEDVAGVPLPEEPDLAAELQAALDQIPLFGITDPLLTAVVSGGSANGVLDLDSGGTTAGGDEPFVQVSIAGGVMELFGQDPETGTITLAAGESQTIAEGTPLESSISVGALTTDDEAEFEDSGLSGSTATASATTVSLLTGAEGGIVLSLAESFAGVYGSTITTTSEDDDPLPNTGGGAAVAAALALGAALLLRRRRD